MSKARFTGVLLGLLAACSTKPSPTQPPRPAPPLTGILRVDDAAIECGEVVEVRPDGGATLLCTYTRDRGCALRQLGSDGEEIGHTDLARGRCIRWVPRQEGGGYIVSSVDKRTLTITGLDRNGKHTTTTSLTSSSTLTAQDAALAPNGDVIIAFALRGLLAHRNHRLASSEYTVGGLVQVGSTLERVAWIRVFDARRTEIAALLPATHHGVDALVNILGPLVPGASSEGDGSMFGGDTYGWTAERIALAPDGMPAAATDVTVERGQEIPYAAQIGDTLAMLNASYWGSPTVLALHRPRGQNERRALGVIEPPGFHVAHGRAWVLEGTWSARKRHKEWTARELDVRSGGNFVRGISLAPGIRNMEWTSIAARDDRVVAIGRGPDPVTGVRVAFTVLAATVRATEVLDLAALQRIDRRNVPPECRDRRVHQIGIPSDRRLEIYAALESCGIKLPTVVAVVPNPDGGVQNFSIQGANAAAVACARRVIEPLFACPLGLTDGMYLILNP